MFTGIIEELGTIERITRTSEGGVVAVTAKTVLDGTRLGDSIAVNGVCLTATTLPGGSFTADMSKETLESSSLAKARPGDRVNLERAVAVGQRLGGHIVQGHVDAVGEFRAKNPTGTSVVMRFGFPAEIGKYIAHKGSIAVDGVSLTVAGLGPDWFEVAVIPTTLQWTTLATLKPGAHVNLETDVLAKYLERLLSGGQGKSPYDAGSGASGLTVERLRNLGY